MTLSSSRYPGFWKFILPFSGWLFLARDFFLNKVFLIEDSFAIYAVVKYYLDHLVSGVFPSWNPYLLWGMGHIHQVGEFNPVWSLIPLLGHFGVGTYQAFLGTICLYWFLGLLGFYHLAKSLLQDPCLAYGAFVLLMFSSLGMTLFVQLTYLLIFVPSVWFFFFLSGWLKTWSRTSFLGLVFSLMIIMTTYIPFYFLTVFILISAVAGAMYPRQVLAGRPRLMTFFRNNKRLVLIGGAGLLMACWGPVTTFLFFRDGLTAQVRATSLTFGDVKDSGVPIVEFARDFSIFNVFLMVSSPRIFLPIRTCAASLGFDFFNQRIFYVPMITHILFFVSLWTKIQKKLLGAFLITFVLFLICIPDTVPVYRFLFNSIPGFNLFRNVFLFSPFLLAAYILWTLAQGRCFFTSEAEVSRVNKGTWGWIFFVHVCFGMFLFRLPSAGNAAVLTAAGSLMFMILFGRGVFKKYPALACGLWLGLSLLQPAEVFSQYTDSARRVEAPVAEQSRADTTITPHFAFQRPPLNKIKYQDLDDHGLYQMFYRHMIEQEDAPGFFSSIYGYPTVWSKTLYQQLGERLRPYTRYKFVIYDGVYAHTETETDFNRLGDDLSGRHNRAAIIVDDASGTPEQGRVKGEPFAQAIESGSEHFRVTDFNSDRIRLKTAFDKNKFLVYNDSFHPWWRAYVNGVRVRLFRSNYAFKGIWLPAGDNDVRFEFHPPLGQGSLFLALIVFWGFFISLVSMACRDNMCGHNEM